MKEPTPSPKPTQQPEPKRMFIHVVGEKKHEVERFITTLSERQPNEMGLGRITVDENLVLYLRGFDEMPMFNLSGDPRLFGYIVLFDGANANHFWDVRWRINAFRTQSKAPFVLAALFDNLEQAYTIDTLRAALGASEQIPLVRCLVRDRASVKQAVLTLLYQVIEAMAEEDRRNQG